MLARDPTASSRPQRRCRPRRARRSRSRSRGGSRTSRTCRRWAPLRRAVARAPRRRARAAVWRGSRSARRRGRRIRSRCSGGRSDARGRVWVRAACRCCRTGRRAGCRGARSGPTSWSATGWWWSSSAARDAAAARPARVRRADRDRRGPLADAARGVPRPQPARALREPALRAGRVRDERALRDADGLAGRAASSGIHGTDRPEILPGRVSHGCIRMRNADIVRLARLMPVGTPVEIR